MEKEQSVRYRVNVSQTSTGKMSWDCTVDGAGWAMGEVMKESDNLVAELKRRYPPEIPPVKDKS